jgi:hypothetical protein
MDIETRLLRLKKWELENLARQLKVTGYSGKNKSDLIDHIIEIAKKQQIAGALNGLPMAAVGTVPGEVSATDLPWWKRHKIGAMISLIGSIASIIGIFIAIDQGEGTKVIEKRQYEISKQLENYDPIKRDQIIKQREKVIEELKTSLKDERSGNTKERKEALKALKKGNTSKARELFTQHIKKDRDLDFIRNEKEFQKIINKL